MVNSFINLILIFIFNLIGNKNRVYFYFRIELEKIAFRYNLQISVKEALFCNLNTVHLICLSLKKGETIVDFSKVILTFSLKKLIKYRVLSQSLDLSANDIIITRSKAGSKQEAFSSNKAVENYSEKCYRLFKKISNIFHFN